MKAIDIYYFSGTGNTLLVVKKMKEVFQEKGAVCRLFPLEKFNPATIDTGNMVGLAFPVAVFSTYPFVMDFVKFMPRTEGTKVFMVDTMGGLSLGIRGYLFSVLKSKGYVPYACKQIVMPDNFWPTEKKEKKVQRVVGKGMDKAGIFAENIISGKVSWKGFPFIPAFLCYISQALIKTKGFRTSLKFEQAKCIKCGLCSKLCPVKNITMNDYPVLSDKCCLCARCHSFCPTGALYRPRKDGSRIVYRAVKADDLL